MAVLNNEERIEFVRLLSKKNKKDILDENLDILFEDSDDEINYAYIIKKLYEIEVVSDKLLLEVNSNLGNIIKKSKVKKFWNEDFLFEISRLLCNNNLDDKVLFDIEINIKEVFVNNYKKILQLGEYKFKTITMLLNMGLAKNKIYELKDEIRENINGEDLLKFNLFLHKNNNDFDESITTEEVLNKMFNSKALINYKDAVPQLSSEINNLMIKNNLSLLDIQPLGEGSYSKVLKVGNKVVKIGGEREVDAIPKHPLIIENELFKNFNGVCIEIQDYVNNRWFDNKSDFYINECEYEIFKNLRDDGIYWSDIRKENIGLKENGDLIIIDRDYIYTDNDFVHMPNKYLEFSQRYNLEKKFKVRKK